MKIIVDADGCPVKDIVVKIAKRFKIEVLMIKNTSHQISDGYSRVITVDKGADVADFEIVKHTSSSDLVITQDYGLAAMVLPKAAGVMHQDGWFYTEMNIDMLLMRRYVSKKARDMKKKGFKVKKRDKADNQAFESALLEWVSSRVE